MMLGFYEAETLNEDAQDPENGKILREPDATLSNLRKARTLAGF